MCYFCQFRIKYPQWFGGPYFDKTDSSGIQQKINETHVTTKSEINNDNATKH